MKNKYVKLLTATALTSVMSTGIAMSQLKISGYQETSMITGSAKGTESAKTLATESSLTFNMAGKLNNGMDYSMLLDTIQFGLQSRLVQVSTGSIDVYGGAEAVKGIETVRTIPAYVNNRIQDITNGTGLTDANDGTSSENFIGFDIRNLGPNGRLSVTYTPNSDQVGRVAPGFTQTMLIQTTDTAGTTSAYSKVDGAMSILTAGYVVDIVPSLRVGVGILKGDAQSAANDDGSTKTAGVRFTQSPFTLGYQYHKNDNHTAIATSQTNVVNSFSATYALTKDLSVGIAQSKQERTIEGVRQTADLKVTALQAGYSLGAMVLQYDYMLADGVNHVSGHDQSLHKVKAKINF